MGIFIILSSLPSYLIRFKLFGIPTTALEGMILLTFLIWIIEKMNFQFLISNSCSCWASPAGKQQNAKCQMLKIKDQWLLFFFIFLFLLSATIGMFVSPDLKAASGIWKAYFIEPILFFIVLVSTLRSVKDLKLIISALAISALYISLYALAQRFFGIPIPAPWQSELRVTSIFPYPNAVGLYLAPLVPLFVYQLISNFSICGRSRPLSGQFLSLREITRRVIISNKMSNVKCQMSEFLVVGWWLLVVSLSVLAIYFAKSEAALVALMCGLIFFLLFYNNKTRLVLILIFLLFFILYSLFPNNDLFLTIENKLLLKDWSGITRRAIWSETWQMLKDRPIFGAGLSGYQTAILPYHKAAWMEVFLYPHNILFNFWSELGLLGLISFSLLIGWFFVTIIKFPISNSQFPIKFQILNFKLIKLFTTSSMVVLLIHGLVDVPYFKNDLSILFWTIMALPIIINKDIRS